MPTIFAIEGSKKTIKVPNCADWYCQSGDTVNSCGRTEKGSVLKNMADEQAQHLQNVIKMQCGMCKSVGRAS